MCRTLFSQVGSLPFRRSAQGKRSRFFGDTRKLIKTIRGVGYALVTRSNRETPNIGCGYVRETVACAGDLGTDLLNNQI